MMPKVNTLVMALALAACLLAPGARARRLRRSPVPVVATNRVLPGVQATSNDASCTTACTSAVQSCKIVCNFMPLAEARICDTVCEASGAVCNAYCIKPQYQLSASASTTTVPLAVTTAFGRAPATWTKLAARSGAKTQAQLGGTCEDLCTSAEIACEVACALEIFGEPECGIACGVGGEACRAAC